MAELLGEVFGRSGIKRQIRRAEAVLLWPHVVGPEVAKFTQARSLKDGLLIVDVSDSETAMHLNFTRQKFLDVYRAKFGIGEVREIRFRVGRISEAPARPAPQPEVGADPKALAAFARHLADLNLPETVARPAFKAAKAMLAYRARRQAQGWRPCPVCEALTPDGRLCSTCARYSADLRVREAAYLLAAAPQAPTPRLAEEERAVATYLAQRYLEEKLLSLLPQVLADPAQREALALTARCYLAHRLGRPLETITDDDFEHLDARVARALGRWKRLG
jgi:predicted nucleic acid-binding Zn ribbon protein